MKMQFETSLAEEIHDLIEGRIEEQAEALTVIIERAIGAVLDDDAFQLLDERPESAIETEVYNPGSEPTDLAVFWTIDLEALADWSGVSLDVLQEALAAEVEGIAPVLDGVAGFAEFQQKLAAEIEGRSRRLEA